MPRAWQRTANGVVLHIRLQPRASRNRLVGLRGEAIRLALTAPPVEGAANTALLTFLAALLQVPRSSLSLLSGEKSRNKHVFVQTPSPESLLQRLEVALATLDKKEGSD